MNTQHSQEKWQYNENFNWKTHPFSVTVRKRGVHSTVVANIPTRATIPPQEQMANARLIAAALRFKPSYGKQETHVLEMSER